MSESTNLFESMRVVSCDQHDQGALTNEDSECKIGKVITNVKFVLDPAISNACNKNENCGKYFNVIFFCSNWGFIYLEFFSRKTKNYVFL